ncbi:synaptonemal complex protein 2 [Ascaphus truei]|uniref:synaptonemal complex protein 2 n=1 Tax=Ascaphus truei TaxID=8439 RepID=UPI003F597C57
MRLGRVLGMTVKPELQLEAHIDDALRRHELHPLEEFLQSESCDVCPQKCSKQLTAKLDKLICRELDKKEIKNVSVLLNAIYKYGKSMTSNGENWLTASIKQGLVQKMIVWFEKCTGILAHGGKPKHQALINLVEDLFDVVMIVHDHNNDGKIQILENFILRACSLISDPTLNTFIKQEAVRKVNVMLDTIPQDVRKKILFTQEMSSTMSAMGKRILDAGDYDLQVAITEALCRMTSEKQRGDLARQWFPMGFVTDAFKGIKDSDFETDCRKFLNLVNGMLGVKRRVFTYPCLSAYLENHELRIPSDEKLEEFWIDFNVGTQSISFYIATDDNGEDYQWETVCITEEDVEAYNVEEIGTKKLLTVVLRNPTTVGHKDGSQIRIYFDSVLDIFDVTRKVFGSNKFKGFTKKQTVSVAKTAVHILFDESGSQILIPESQVSISSAKHVTEPDVEKSKMKNQLLSTTSNLNQCTNQDDSNHSKLVTPSKSKVSEASMIIPITGGLNMRTPSVVSKTSTPRQGRVKPPLEMIHSAEKTSIPISTVNKSVRNWGRSNDKIETQHFQKLISAAQVVEMMQADEDVGIPEKGEWDEHTEIVPDTDPGGRKDSPLLPGLNESYLGECEINTKQITLEYERLTSKCLEEKISVSKRFLSNQDKMVSDRKVKQQAFYSIFEDENSPKHEGETVKADEITENRPLVRACKNTNKETSATYLSASSKVTETKSVEKKKCRNTVKNEKISKPEMPLKSSDYNRTNEISKNCAKKEVSTKNSDRTSGRKRTINRKQQEISPEAAGFSLAAMKDTERETKEKAKELVDAAQSLISKIGSKYSCETVGKNPGENTSARKKVKKYALCTNKAKSQKGSFSLQKTKDFSVTTREIGNDVYSFKFSGSDDPTIKLGVSETHVDMRMSGGGLPRTEKSAEKKQNSKTDNEKKPANYYNQKHIFSDTDTDRGGDESKTDISWLHYPRSKEKPKFVGYSRQKTVKKTDGSLEHKQTKIAKNNAEEKTSGPCHQATCASKSNQENPKRTIEQNMHKRPRRAAIRSKCYKEISNSEPESDEEPAPPSPSRKAIFKPQYDLPKTKKPQSVEKPRKPEKPSPIKPSPVKPQKKQPKIETKTAANKKTAKCAQPAMSPVSPASIEQVRCEEYVSDTEIKTKLPTIARSSSPSLCSSSPENVTPDKSNGISAATFYSAAGKTDRAQWVKSAEKSIERAISGKESCSLASSPVSLPTLTRPSLSKSAIDRINKELSPPELATQEQPLNTTTSVSNKVLISAAGKQNKTEDNSSASCQSVSSGRRKSGSDMLHTNVHESGPTVRTAASNLKRIYNANSDSEDNNTEEDDHKEKRRKPKLHPRKLFKSKEVTAFTCRVSESLSTVSGNEVSTMDGSVWEGSDSGVGVMCQKISKEFTRKIQNRSRKMDYFTKHSLKSAQQHLTSMNVQVRECRVKYLDRFQETILGEIANFEKDSQSLKNMEKEFTNFWKQQTQALNVYQKNEHRRIHHLKSSFEKNVFHSIDYEENIFTSEMHLMKEDMKLVQERLLKELQEEELLSVRRGLQSLFMAGPRAF